MELGLYSFGETTPSYERARTPTTPQRRMCELVEEAKLAEQVGLDVFGIGEHHRPDFIVSAPAVVLGAIASKTSRIRLTSAVTVLSSDDPVRVFQEFATLDLLSHGRAEIMAGRGSFVEPFPLFGFDLDDYDELFAEKLDLLLRIREDAPVTWRGRLRAPLRDQLVMPRPVQHPLPVWIAVGGTPASAQRTGALGEIGRERGWPAPTREQYDLLRTPRGALLVGDPKTVADKILFQYDIFRNTRYLIYLMGMPHDTVMRAIELYGTRVAPLVREGLRERGVQPAVDTPSN